MWKQAVTAQTSSLLDNIGAIHELTSFSPISTLQNGKAVLKPVKNRVPNETLLFVFIKQHNTNINKSEW